MTDDRGKGYEYDRDGGRMRRGKPKPPVLPEDSPGERAFRREFDAVLEAAIARLPQKLKDALKEIEIIVDDYPEPALLRRPGVRPFPPTILGFFTGTPLNKRSTFHPMEWPPQIYLFRKNIRRDSRTVQEMNEQIFITLMHELGHALGLEEGDLRDRGIT